MKAFKLNDKVSWKSQANGSMTEKTGIIVEVVPSRKYPVVTNVTGSSWRDHESYVVKVGSKYYWARVSHLSLVDDASSLLSSPECFRLPIKVEGYSAIFAKKDHNDWYVEAITNRGIARQLSGGEMASNGWPWTYFPTPEAAAQAAKNWKDAQT